MSRWSPSGPRSKRWRPTGVLGQPGKRTVDKLRCSWRKIPRHWFRHLSLGHVELVLPQFPVGQGDDDAGCPVTWQAEHSYANTFDRVGEKEQLLLLALVPHVVMWWFYHLCWGKKWKHSRKGFTHRLQWRSIFAHWPGGEFLRRQWS